MTQYYFYYAEVFELGSGFFPIWVGDGTAALTDETIPELRDKLRKHVMEYVSNSTGVAEFKLNVVVKQFNRV